MFMILKKVSYRQKEAVLRSALNRVSKKLPKESFVSSSPSPFVGRFGYPVVNLGVLTTLEVSDSAWLYDAPRFWSSENFKISDIVGLRAELINSSFKISVKKFDSVLASVQEIALSKKPVDVEVKTSKPPGLFFRPDSFMAPVGAFARLQKFNLTSNPKIPTIVQKFYDDTDCRSVEALTTLYSKGFDETSLSKMLSVGSFGLEKHRKLVPTRWSITATDDVLGKNLIDEVKDFPLISDFLLFKGVYLGNFYFVLFFPGKWQFELFESYVASNEFSTDFESFSGRKDYAGSCAGGYYSVRLAVLEKLRQLKRQASVLVLRFISDDYFIPLGVWVTREAARKALKNQPLKFSDKNVMLEFMKKISKQNFGVDSSVFFRISRLLSQKSLADF